jgi:hypothetical protein
MTHFLVTSENPKGHKLEDILAMIRKDILTRTLNIADDPRTEARQVMQNNMKILGLISEAIALAENSTQILAKAFGPSKPGKSRIGYP